MNFKIISCPTPYQLLLFEFHINSYKSYEVQHTRSILIHILSIYHRCIIIINRVSCLDIPSLASFFLIIKSENFSFSCTYISVKY